MVYWGCLKANHEIARKETPESTRSKPTLCNRFLILWRIELTHSHQSWIKIENAPVPGNVIATMTRPRLLLLVCLTVFFSQAFGQNQNRNTTAAPPVLLTEEDSWRAVALDSVTFVRDPFSQINNHNFSSDRRTRIVLFSPNIDLAAGEDRSSASLQSPMTKLGAGSFSSAGFTIK